MMRRNAFTLIELMMTVTLSSSLMLLAIGLVHQSLSLSKLATHRGEHNQTLWRLATQFREDVHAASETVVDQPQSITLKNIGGSAVIYSWSENTLSRKRSADALQTANEDYRFDELCSGEFQALSSPSRAVLQIHRRLKDEDAPTATDLRVVAIVDRWRGLEQSAGEEP